jgi:uncharacterized protein
MATPSVIPSARSARRGSAALAVTSLLLLATSALAAYTPPALTGPVVDRAGLLSSADESRLDGLIRRLREQGGTQIGILTEPDLGGLSIEEASIKVAEKWQLGSAAKDDGILIMIAKAERAVRIEVGQGREGDLPDAYARRIVDDVMIPHLKQGEFGNALLAGVQAITARTDPGFDAGAAPARRPASWSRERGAPIPFNVLFILFLIFVFVIRSRARRSGLLGGLIGYSAGRSWGSRSSGWGGGGGGSWGGGGGGFSGGGASGRW